LLLELIARWVHNPPFLVQWLRESLKDELGIWI
jgi:hypothetical protein